MSINLNNESQEHRPLCVLSVGDRVTNDLRKEASLSAEAMNERVRLTHVLEENLENTAGLLIDETRDTLDTATTGKTTNSGLSDTYDH